MSDPHLRSTKQIQCILHPGGVAMHQIAACLQALKIDLYSMQTCLEADVIPGLEA